MLEKLLTNKPIIDGAFNQSRLTPPVIVTERIAGINIGRITLDVQTLNKWEPNARVTGLLNQLNSSNSDKIRSNLRFTLSNNTPNEDPINPIIAHNRAVSAYFTYNPHNETVIVEWGTIDPNSEEAKLHNYLNKMIDFQDRVSRGMRLSSGHLAKLKDSNEYFALFDELNNNSLQPDKTSPLGKTINTLYRYGFIPLTTDSYLQLPAF